MTNLEFYKDEICKGLILCKMAHILNYGKHCGAKSCACCEFHNIDNKGVDKCIDLLLAEHKEPIKLKQWEYDAIKYHGQLSKFHDIHFLMAMKNKGYFKDMNSVEKCSMTIK